MTLYLKRFAEQDGIDTYYMLQAMGRDENGSFHEVNRMSKEEYHQWLKKNSDSVQERQISYWLMADGQPIGYGRIQLIAMSCYPQREEARLDYAVLPTQRGKGYGNILLQLLLEECGRQGISEVEVSANQDNERSNRVIRRNGGVLCKSRSGKNIYRIRSQEYRRESVFKG